MTETKLDLTSLRFGAPAAERDIDLGLVDYFIESDAYTRVASRAKTIVLGNRGTGKSAIFKVLAAKERSRGSVVLELRPEDYSYEMLQSVLQSEADGAWAKQGAFAIAWKYLILLLVMKGLTDKSTRGKSGAATRIHKYLRDNHKNEQENPIEILVSYLKRLEGIKIGKYEAGAKTRELASLYRLEELEPFFSDIVELCQAQRVLVFVDELDKGWDSSEDAKAFVAGLFQACVSVNEICANLTVYVSLRQELYENIPALYEDAQKYRDVIETVRWDEKSLLALVASRIRHAVPMLQGAADDVTWTAVFADVLDYRNAKSFNYMVDRTLYRPREIIQFCTDCVEQVAKSQAYPIDYATISSAELVYSESRAKDIAAEYRFQYPGLLSVFEVFRGRQYTMERDELELLCLGITCGEHAVDPSAGSWALGQDPDFLIDVLWRVGFLKAYAVGGLKALRRSGSSYVGSHQLTTPNLGTFTRFQVHQMFRAYLGMKEAKGS